MIKAPQYRQQHGNFICVLYSVSGTFAISHHTAALSFRLNSRLLISHLCLPSWLLSKIIATSPTTMVTLAACFVQSLDLQSSDTLLCLRWRATSVELHRMRGGHYPARKLPQLKPGEFYGMSRSNVLYYL